MKKSYLEVTFRQGRPLAAYYYLPRNTGEKSFRTSKAELGLIIDYNKSGRPIGIEITDPEQVTLAAFNRVLIDLGFPPIKSGELAPLCAA